MLRRFPDLRLHSALGGLAFAAFCTFWVTLVLQLSTLGYGARTAGLYGAVGVVGALTAPLVGRFADANGGRRINVVRCALILVSFGLLSRGRGSLLLIGLAVVLLDFGTQASHINNQARIFALDPAARSRLNTVYMMTYFTGGCLRFPGRDAGLGSRGLDRRVRDGCSTFRSRVAPARRSPPG